MAVRNFWVDCLVDGRKTHLCGGPKSKLDGMEVHLYQRREGVPELILSVCCGVEGIRDPEIKISRKLLTDIRLVNPKHWEISEGGRILSYSTKR